jgi:hypothetical protein
MKTLLAAILFISTSAAARTQAIFSADGTKATVLLMSMLAGDSDAAGLYVAMTAPEEVIDGKRTKRLAFDNAEGSRALSIVCVLSAFVASNGTCTVILHASANTSIDKGTTTARLSVIEPADLAKIVPAFRIPQADPVFATDDGHFAITTVREGANVVNFEVNYR